MKNLRKSLIYTVCILTPASAALGSPADCYSKVTAAVSAQLSNFYSQNRLKADVSVFGINGIGNFSVGRTENPKYSESVDYSTYNVQAGVAIRDADGHAKGANNVVTQVRFDPKTCDTLKLIALDNGVEKGPAVGSTYPTKGAPSREIFSQEQATSEISQAARGMCQSGVGGSGDSSQPHRGNR